MDEETTVKHVEWEDEIGLRTQICAVLSKLLQKGRETLYLPRLAPQWTKNFPQA